MVYMTPRLASPNPPKSERGSGVSNRNKGHNNKNGNTNQPEETQPGGPGHWVSKGPEEERLSPCESTPSILLCQAEATRGQRQAPR